MRAVVTGAAGFIGSHLCDRLLADGYEVAGIDAYSEPYSRTAKEANLRDARTGSDFAFYELDLFEDDLAPALDGADFVFHLAGRSGVRASRRHQFDHFVRDNILATQRLLEALAGRSVQRFVYAGSSSVYGDAERLPTKESSIARPLSAYGLTKLAGENLVQLYAGTLRLPAVSLRYFSVYGPRQRPDMAIARFMHGLRDGGEVDVYGDGEQTRDFTYVSDVVDATVAAATAPVAGMTFNVGGGTRATLNEVLAALENVTGRTVTRRYRPAAYGDHRHGGASINLARRHLPWEPRVSLQEGLTRQWAWFQQTPEMSEPLVLAV